MVPPCAEGHGGGCSWQCSDRAKEWLRLAQYEGERRLARIMECRVWLERAAQQGRRPGSSKSGAGVAITRLFRNAIHWRLRMQPLSIFKREGQIHGGESMGSPSMADSAAVV